jgi:hypothetical protein
MSADRHIISSCILVYDNHCENTRFSLTACLLRHEREAHEMHGHGEKPFLCTFEGCERGVPGNGFLWYWKLCDHMKRLHNRSPPPQNAILPRVHNRSPSPAKLRKSEKLISMIREVRRLSDIDALENLMAADGCLKSMMEEVMKTKRGSGRESSK